MYEKDENFLKPLFLARIPNHGTSIHAQILEKYTPTIHWFYKLLRIKLQSLTKSELNFIHQFQFSFYTVLELQIYRQIFTK